MRSVTGNLPSDTCGSKFAEVLGPLCSLYSPHLLPWIYLATPSRKSVCYMRATKYLSLIYFFQRIRTGGQFGCCRFFTYQVFLVSLETSCMHSRLKLNKMIKMLFISSYLQNSQNSIVIPKCHLPPIMVTL